MRVNKGGLFKAKSMNEVDAGRDRAMPASVRHDDDVLREEGARDGRRRICDDGDVVGV